MTGCKLTAAFFAARVHDRAYIQTVKDMSKDTSKGHHTCGDVATFAPGGFDIACMAAGDCCAASILRSGFMTDASDRQDVYDLAC